MTCATIFKNGKNSISFIANLEVVSNVGAEEDDYDTDKDRVPDAHEDR